MRYDVIRDNPIMTVVRSAIFNSKWVLIVFYFGLAVAQILYAYRFAREIIELCWNFQSMDENSMMLSVLMLVDVAMIANLIWTIISGSYYSFLDKTEGNLEKISSGYLKVKMGMSLVGISSVHLLQVFISSHASDREVIVKCSIHMVFLISTIGLGLVEFLHEKSKTFVGGSH